MHLGRQAETAKSKTNHPLASISVKFEGMLIKIVQPGGVLGGLAETAKSQQKYPLASISFKIEGMLLKSCSLEVFWAARLKPRKVSKSTQ